MGKRVGKKRLTQNTQSDRNRIYERMFNSAGIISNRSCLFEIKIRELKLLMTDIESAWESMRKAKDELEMCNVDFRYLDRIFDIIGDMDITDKVSTRVSEAIIKELGIERFTAGDICKYLVRYMAATSSNWQNRVRHISGIGKLGSEELNPILSPCFDVIKQYEKDFNV